MPGRGVWASDGHQSPSGVGKATPLEPASELAARRRRFRILLSVVLVLGAALRLAALGQHSFWFDEVVAMRVATAPSLAGFSERLARMDMVGAPLHPLLLRYWTAVWGTSEAAARGLSAAFSILALCALAATAWQAFRLYKAVLVATALLAVCPLDLTYAMENRMYSLLELWTIAAWGLLFSFRRGRSLARELAFGLSLVGLAYTHSLGGMMILALALGYLIDVRRSALPPSRWLALQLLAFAAILPWAGRYADHPPDPKLGLETASILFNWMAYGLGIPMRFLPVLIGLVALGWLVPARGPRRASESGCGPTGEERLRTALMLSTWVALPLGLMAAYTWLRHPILGPIRYQVFLMPGLILLIAGGVWFRPLTAGVCVATLVLAFTPRSLRTVVFDDQRKPAWREATHEILRRSPDPIVVLAAREPHMYYKTVNYYLPDGVPVISLQTYRDRLAAGTLDRARDCWLFHDKMDAKGEADQPAIPPSRQSGPNLEFGRLTVVRLDPAAARLPRPPQADPRWAHGAEIPRR